MSEERGRCVKCGRRDVASYVPVHGDGSLRLAYRHKLKNGQWCTLGEVVLDAQAGRWLMSRRSV